MNKFEEWCNNLKNYWENKEVENIITLFDENVVYYETPKMKISSFNEVKKIWEEIKNQNTDKIDFKILCVDNNKCIANYILDDEISYDMIYEIVLNNENKCIYFKQWYMDF